MKAVHDNGVALDVEILNYYLGVCVKLVDAFLGDNLDPHYPARRESLNQFLENPSLKIEGRENLNLIDLQNFLPTLGEQNPAQRDAVLASLKQHLQAQLQDHFSKCPVNLIKNKILPKLSNKSQFSFARTDKRNFSIFADFLVQDLAPQLALHVVRGQPDEAEKLILKKKRVIQDGSQKSLADVALQHANVEDYSRRRFPAYRLNPNPEGQARFNPNASPLKLNRWIRDWYLIEILLMNLPQELRAKAKEQIQNVKLFGLDYGNDMLLDGEVTQKMCDEQGAAVLDGRTSAILRGCELVMLSLSENEKIDEADLREISKKHDEQPILIKHRGKTYLYGFKNNFASTESVHEWCVSELQHPGFSKLDFPTEFRNPKRKYLALGKASETLTESMHAEIVRTHGEMAYPYSCVLISIAGDEKLKKQDLDRIAAENSNQPILLKQESAIFLYEHKFGEDKWIPAKLIDPGFQDLAFPKTGYCSLKLTPRKTNETLTQEMRHEMSTAHNFVDYRVQCGVPVKTAQGIKTPAHVQVLGERCFDYHPLIEALKAFIEVRTLWENADYPEGSLQEAVDYQWNRVVGLVQCYATAFLGQQYCHPKRSFENVKFDEQEFRGQDRSLKFYDYTKEKNVFWFLRDSGLGSDFGIMRASPRGVDVHCVGHARWAGWGAAALDLPAIETLCEVSSERLASVEQKYLDDAVAPSNSFG